jgi:hypothetical protein
MIFMMECIKTCVKCVINYESLVCGLAFFFELCTTIPMLACPAISCFPDSDFAGELPIVLVATLQAVTNHGNLLSGVLEIAADNENEEVLIR